MSSIIILNPNHVINRASEEYLNKLHQMTVQFNNLPLTKSTLNKLRTDQSKDESKAQLIKVKVEDMGATLLDVRIKQAIRINQINYLQNELTLRNTNNNAVNEAKEEERQANERAGIARIRRQQAELGARLEASEARVAPRGTTRTTAPPRRERSRSPATVPARPPPETSQPNSPTENLGFAVDVMHVGESDEEDKRPIRVILDADHKTCTVCSNDLKRNDICVLDCGHCFHFICAHRAYRSDSQHRCPTCRAIQVIVPRSCQASARLLDEELLDEVFPPSSS
jgi:hypothetical protein